MFMNRTVITDYSNISYSLYKTVLFQRMVNNVVTTYYSKEFYSLYKTAFISDDISTKCMVNNVVTTYSTAYIRLLLSQMISQMNVW